MKRNQALGLLAWPLSAIIIGICLWTVACDSQNIAVDVSTKSVPYKILNDEMGTVISIGVEANINEEQLRVALAKAANEHQDDEARDYLTSMYLRVDAYLVREERQSSIPAGRLRRYVPPGNAASRKKVMVDRSKWDSFIITLDEARQTLE